jgi:uncharacterized protein YggU (UPF0235/DUF167 family)
MAKLRFFVKPNARINEIGRDQEGKLWLKIAAPPLEGKANHAICLYLAEIFSIPKSSVQLLAGSSGKIKTFEIDLSQEEIKNQLSKLIA